MDKDDKLMQKEIDILSKRAIEAFFKKINEMK